MSDTKLPTVGQETTPLRAYTVLVTRSVMEMLTEPDRHPDLKWALDIATHQALNPETVRIGITMLPDSFLAVHVCPEKQAVVVLNRYAGWPYRVEEYLEELLPFCTPLSLA